MSFTDRSSQVSVFDADEVPHCAPTVIAFAAVVSIATVRAAAVSGMNRGEMTTSDVPRCR
jgi:hypothetical protein